MQASHRSFLPHSGDREPSFIARHQAVWARKPALRWYYEREIFGRLLAALPPGRTLELGSGPGFFGRHLADVVSTDVSPIRGVDAVADAHNLPFASSSFAAVTAIDVLHHLASPKRALAECARVLRPGGRAAFVEPWAGALGGLMYKYAHHEDCFFVERPWEQVAPPGKDPMHGNAAVSRMLFGDGGVGLAEQVPGLRLNAIEHFGVASYLITGGFQRWGLPRSVVEVATRVEGLLPRGLLTQLALRVLIVIERT